MEKVAGLALFYNNLSQQLTQSPMRTTLIPSRNEGCAYKLMPCQEALPLKGPPPLNATTLEPSFQHMHLCGTLKP
jgi:hypothetical protein